MSTGEPGTPEGAAATPGRPDHTPVWTLGAPVPPPLSPPGPAPWIPAQPGGLPAYPAPLPPVPPKRPDRARAALRVILLATIVVALLCGIGDGALAVLNRGSSATFTGGVGNTNTALTDLLNRRASAVLSGDEKAFLADVDPSRPTFVEHEKEEFENLQALGLSQFTLAVYAVNRYPLSNPDPAVAASFERGLSTVAVLVRYAVKGVDDRPVAAPWIAVVGERGGHWYVADEMTKGASLPEGVGGQPWETGPIVVKRDAHVVAVISKDDERIAPQLMSFADKGVANALNFLSSGWSGKVLVTAVSDSAVIGSYFQDNAEQLGNVAAVAVPSYTQVYGWSNDLDYVTSRVLFNPDSLGRDSEQLQETLTHEFIHVATGPITTGYTPTWLVEGIAEYVAYDTSKVPDSDLRYRFQQLGYPTELPDDSGFYEGGYRNYLWSAEACRYLVKKYGKAKLLDFYRSFVDQGNQESSFESVLGVSQSQFTTGWVAFVHSL